MPEVQQIQARLADYLGAQPERLRVLASGWETTVFEFALGSPSPRLDAVEVNAPLVLRFYHGEKALDKGTREYRTMRELALAGYTVPRPYLFEADCSVVGAPFLVMDLLSGGPLFVTQSFPQAFKIFLLGFTAFVRAQARLHGLKTENAPLGEIPRAYQIKGAPATMPILDRVLHVIAERIESGPLPGLKDAWARLRGRAGAFRAAPESVLHMDYHPQNVIVRGTRVMGVIDWVNADCGDRHLDAAMTAVILSSSAREEPRWMRDNWAGNSLRKLFSSLYVPLYHAFAPIDFGRLRYCQAVAALLRLSMLGMMRARGAQVAGFRPEAISEVTPSVIRLLSRYAARKSGVPVRLDLTAAAQAA
jgi:aminoglycoside phosphotransferase (APT) family kinase protein